MLNLDSAPDRLERRLVEQRVERFLDGFPRQILYVLAQRLLDDHHDVRGHDPHPPLVNDFLPLEII